MIRTTGPQVFLLGLLHPRSCVEFPELGLPPTPSPKPSNGNSETFCTFENTTPMPRAFVEVMLPAQTSVDQEDHALRQNEGCMQRRQHGACHLCPSVSPHFSNHAPQHGTVGHSGGCSVSLPKYATEGHPALRATFEAPKGQEQILARQHRR